MLTIKSVHAYYGGIHALKGVSLHVGSGEIITLVGANGAGKTTLIKAICGLLKPSKGTIVFKGHALNDMATEKITALGIGLVPEGREVFAGLSVDANLEMGAFIHRKKKNFVEEMKRKIFDRFPVLLKKRKYKAGTLSGGEQQMLAIGRALMGNPDFIILDEPSMGLAPMIVSEIFAIIGELRREGKTILLVEQNARAALKIADRGYVFETGKIVLEGLGSELLEHREVQRAYLGRSEKR